MDNTRFDRLARVVGAGTTRRAALTLLAGLGLSSLSLGDPGDAWAKAKSGTCNPACSACETCGKGKCKKTRSGKKRCKKGTCQPLPEGTTCGSGQVCQSGSCVCLGGTEACRGGCVALCPTGQVRNPVTCGCCQPSGPPCTVAVHNCCSGICSPGAINVCFTRPVGAACDFGAQCSSGFCSSAGTCVIPA